MNCLIVSGGVKPKDEILNYYFKQSELVIGVDKGCNYLFNCNIKPNFIVGDFDSSNLKVIDEFIKQGSIKYQYECEKNFTDSMEAFEIAISNKVNKIFFLGATGNRFDHALGNLGLLLKALKSGIHSEIIDDKNKMFLINKDTVIKRDYKYKYVSFLAYNEEINEFSIKGAKYNLDKYNLQIGDSRTVSNEFISDEIKLEISNGNILVIYSKDL